MLKVGPDKRRSRQCEVLLHISEYATQELTGHVSGALMLTEQLSAVR